MAPRRRWPHMIHLDAAKKAMETGIDLFNGVWAPYRNEATLLLIANAWELLAKAVLLREGESIVRGQRGESISAEQAITRLQSKRHLDQLQAETLQQVISLRNAACHGALPDVPPEIMQHLLFFSCKFFRDTIAGVFRGHEKTLSTNYLSLSFADLTTYADRVQKAVSRMKKSAGDKRLVWLLERGIAFDGTAYETEAQFERKYRGKKRILPHLHVGRFLRGADMVRIVPVQAPRNFTADVTLRKGKAGDASLPVLVKKTDVEADYPYLTKELAQKLGKDLMWTAQAVRVLRLKGDGRYHQAVRASATSEIHRYSDAALQALQQKLRDDPGFRPYGVAS